MAGINPAHVENVIKNNHRGVIHLHQIGILQLTQNLDDAVRGFKAGLTRVLQFKKREKPLAVETTGFFVVDSYVNSVMLQ
ncbi:hypothetical protein SOV_23950 [Sporomusa ovata DSM 2662]|uniref:hypothetical protein n=1 Tax=Sporomusa ovata TaxID=2378 RepID=UPI00038867C9|nr:hypothetical protein [Sporomusa ovata]EQB25711.1 hypothetical protein SOV_4c03740 [Sporomusa ovata DSM 2662]